MALGNTEAILERSKTVREGETEISERAFNLIIGGMLLWGFFLNFVTVSLFGEQVLRLLYGTNPFVILIAYFALVIVGNLLVVKGGPALSFLGYTLIAAPIGMVICLCVQGVPISIVKSAVLVTSVVALSFMIAATMFPGFFLKLGRVLGFSLLFMIVGELLCMLLFRGRGFVLYEWLDNAIDLSASLYLDIVNLFLRILSIMSKNRD